MQEQVFRTEELKAALERSLNFPLRDVVRLTGASALNFKAVRENDGYVFVVKCFPSSRVDFFKRLELDLAALGDARIPKRIFPEASLAEFRGHRIICIEWCHGVRMYPDRMSREQLLSFLDDYQEFSSCMQRVTQTFPLRDGMVLKQEIRETFRDGVRKRLARLVEREMPDDDVRHRSERLKVVHGDFHYGNFLFADGRVSGFLDLEEFRLGYPAEDIVRYFVCRAEHLRWYEMSRVGRLLKAFETAVRHLPYPVHEWRVAINGLFLLKVHKRIRRECGWLQILNLMWRARLYRRMRQIAESARGGCG